MLSSYDAQCRTVLEAALDGVPMYQPWRAFDPGNAHSTDARYAALPVTTKRDIRAQFPHGFLPRQCDLAAGLRGGQVEYVQTSGTTDERVTLLWCQPWWDASERASWLLNRRAAELATGGHPEVVMASPLCVGPRYSEGQSLSMRGRTLGRLLFVNEKPDVALWTDADIRRMAGEINAYQPVVLEADPPYLSAFAARIGRLGLRVHQPGLIFFTYSYPSRVHRQQIARVFRAPMASSHGSTETGYVFTECEAGRFHQNTAFCRVDFLPWSRAWGGPDVGLLVVTPFANPWFTILRFNVGDLARLGRGLCPCGRTTGMVLEAIEGRVKDVTLTSAGRPVTIGALDAVMGTVEGLVTYQAEQTGAGAYCVRVVPAAAEDTGVAGRVEDALRGLYGADALLAVQTVAAVTPEPSGKYRLARSMVPLDVYGLLDHRPEGLQP